MCPPLIDTTLGAGLTPHPIDPILPAPDVKKMKREKQVMAKERQMETSCKMEREADVRMQLCDAVYGGSLTVLKASPALRVCDSQPTPPQLDGEWSEDESHGSRDSDSRDSREESGSGGDSREGRDVEDWSVGMGGTGAPDSPSLLLKRGYAALLQKLQTRKAFSTTRPTRITVSS